jgi:predicted DNA repair protein MutK
VGIIVKLDDMGYWLVEKPARWRSGQARRCWRSRPSDEVLSIVGTLAMFLVGGGIVVHGIAPLHHAIENLAHGQNGVIASLLPTGANLVLGFIIGAMVLAGVKAIAAFVVGEVNVLLLMQSGSASSMVSVSS